ncbi:MAG: type III pantothenate kinase [Prevotella sp.]|uniref:type III pantothenate kinase n=1 Tax=Prevotella sp. TaxID=59823 RepID=UPI002A2948D0|nr:type III pantothenate kinase [Prevotella sp.]MDD7318858.1 type III pantothenate kinase [Prevotellaceae bacterium]MDY4019235.1 type III pantothenate kinase [Prevotella sp.]
MISDLHLVVDVGNTSIKMVCFDGRNVVEEIRVSNISQKEASEFISKYKFSCGIYCSTVVLDDNLQSFFDSLPVKMTRFIPGVTPIPIKNLYRTPLTLGADRLAAVIGASADKKGENILVIDSGTCITYDFINSEMEYKGGNISPGIEMRLKSLHSFTSKLPLISAEGDTPDMGYSTETAIRSGVINGVLREIEGYINTFIDKYSQLYVYLTGGSRVNLHFSEKSHTFAPAKPVSTKISLKEDRLLVPKGLNAILEYNKR